VVLEQGAQSGFIANQNQMELRMIRQGELSPVQGRAGSMVAPHHVQCDSVD